MNCQNHTDIEATTRCAGCAEPFCQTCTIDMAGQTYCGACKSLALGGKEPRLFAATQLLTDTGLPQAIIGYFIFGWILGPIAIGKATTARAIIKNDPNLLGWGKATAAMWLGIGALVTSIISLIVRFKS